MSINSNQSITTFLLALVLVFVSLSYIQGERVKLTKYDLHIVQDKIERLEAAQVECTEYLEYLDWQEGENEDYPL